MQVKLSSRKRLRFSAWQAVALTLFGAGFGAAIAIAAVGTLTVAWFGEDSIWRYLLAVPQLNNYYLSAFTVVLLVLVGGVMKLSPAPRLWSRSVVVVILLALTGRYLLWRSLSTLNLADPLNGSLSLGVFGIEVLAIASYSLQLVLLLKAKPRHREADYFSMAVTQGKFTPAVDILIPTYSEPPFILRRTIIGCQALNYAPKTIYLLDDKRRQEMRDLAAELGCEYITRADNRHAKAGNLNHALALTSGELIVVFDADFVPTTNFLTRTVGFFQDQQTALVQTYQSFYNADPVARNLGLETVLTHEEEVCQRHYQLLRDGLETVVCSGTAFVVRRSALAEVGGFVTQSLSEDYFTGIRLAACGYRTLYLSESLSAGLAAENIAAHVAQRLRWARGTLQAFFIQANPLTIPGISVWQRLAHLEGILQWALRGCRALFFLLPPVCLLFDLVPYRATVAESLYFFLPLYGVQFLTLSWLNQRSRSALLSDIYAVFQCFPVLITTIQTVISPFAKGFRVTPKGISSDRYTYNWALASPLAVALLLTGVSLWSGTQASLASASVDGAGILLIWLMGIYNLFVLSVALLILLDAPKPDIYERFPLRQSVRLSDGKQTCWGTTVWLSEGGAEIQLSTMTDLESSIALSLVEEDITLSGWITQANANIRPTVQVTFEPLSQHRRLVELLYCRPGRWQRREAPGEGRSLWLLVLALLRSCQLGWQALAAQPLRRSRSSTG
ncbi:MAG: glycosyltransferase [Cyanophyceae cyanobacterium]